MQPNFVEIVSRTKKRNFTTRSLTNLDSLFYASHVALTSRNVVIAKVSELETWMTCKQLAWNEAQYYI